MRYLAVSTLWSRLLTSSSLFSNQIKLTFRFSSSFLHIISSEPAPDPENQEDYEEESFELSERENRANNNNTPDIGKLSQMEYYSPYVKAEARFNTPWMIRIFDFCLSLFVCLTPQGDFCCSSGANMKKKTGPKKLHIYSYALE